MPAYILIIGFANDSKTWIEYESKDEAKEALKEAIFDPAVVFARILNDREW